MVHPRTVGSLYAVDYKSHTRIVRQEPRLQLYLLDICIFSVAVATKVTVRTFYQSQESSLSGNVGIFTFIVSVDVYCSISWLHPYTSPNVFNRQHDTNTNCECLYQRDIQLPNTSQGTKLWVRDLQSIGYNTAGSLKKKFLNLGYIDLTEPFLLRHVSLQRVFIGQLTNCSGIKQCYSRTYIHLCLDRAPVRRPYTLRCR